MSPRRNVLPDKRTSPAAESSKPTITAHWNRPFSGSRNSQKAIQRTGMGLTRVAKRPMSTKPSTKKMMAVTKPTARIIPVRLDITLNTMLISEGIYQSNRLNREVTAEEVRELSVSFAIKV